MAKMTYESAMLRLEQIVNELDGGNLSLEESIKLFEESTKLSAFCSDCLEKAKLKITTLSSKNED